ncbi:putative protease [Caudoviricetes sp.]|nr:putative protease [Caudoviricetes sp.]
MSDVLETDFDKDMDAFEATPDAPEESAPEKLESFLKGDDEGIEKPSEEKKVEEPSEYKEEDYVYEPEDEALKAMWSAKGEEGEKQFAEFKAFAMEHKIKPDVMKKLIDRHLAQTSKVPEKVQADLASQWDKQVTEWHSAIQSDPEVGGDKYNYNKESAILAIHEFGGKELVQELRTTGFGNHPLLFKAFAKIGKSFREGSFVQGKPVKAEVPLYDRLYNK